MDVLWGEKKGKVTYFQTRPGVKLLLDNWLNMILNISDNGSEGRSCCSRCRSASAHSQSRLSTHVFAGCFCAVGLIPTVFTI